MKTFLRSAAMVLLLAVLSLGLLTWRAVSDGESAMGASDVAFNQGDLRTSLVHARRAATSYAPGAPHVARAYARLQAIAIGAEARGDLEIAQEAWRAVRSAALETRGVTQSHARELERANRALARLATRGQEDPEQRKAVLEGLEQSQGPRARWILVLGLGFVLSTIGLAWLGLRGVNREGSVVRRQLLIGAGLALVGAVCWTVAVWLA
ncbi:MAG: hypothetical protein KC766_02865 [Myxococcales bacterium]|nr:hypothetical protein [Myxococcales bacterium]